MSPPDSKQLNELNDQLHRAAAHFHNCRLELEQVFDGSEYRHGERVAEAQEHLRQAEKEIEEVESRIAQALQSISFGVSNSTNEPRHEN